MTINRYRYFYACAFDMYGDHLFAFVDRMAELDHAESTVNLYLSCINDVAKAMATAGNAGPKLSEPPPPNRNEASKSESVSSARRKQVCSRGGSERRPRSLSEYGGRPISPCGWGFGERPGDTTGYFEHTHRR